MHRNTIVLLIILSIIVAILLGIKVGQKIAPQAFIPPPLSSPSPLPAILEYNNVYCGISLNYNPDLKLSEASESATLVNKETGEKIEITCLKKLDQRPPLPQEKIEEASVAGQTATIYHDTEVSTNKPIDLVVFTHPVNKLEVIFLGFGEVFQQILTTVKIL